MINNNFGVSFGARVAVSPTKLIKNAKASELAQAINNGFNTSGTKIKPARPISGKSLMQLNEDCFDKKTTVLNKKGLVDFDILNAETIGVTVDDNLAKYTKAVRDFVKKFGYDGYAGRLFDQIRY